MNECLTSITERTNCKPKVIFVAIFNIISVLEKVANEVISFYENVSNAIKVLFSLKKALRTGRQTEFGWSNLTPSEFQRAN